MRRNCPGSRAARLAELTRRAFYARRIGDVDAFMFAFDQDIEARRAGHDQVVCEVNTEPPHPDFDAFHLALGFEEIGRAAIHGGAKTIRYLRRGLSGDP